VLVIAVEDVRDNPFFCAAIKVSYISSEPSDNPLSLPNKLSESD
jgi:hypothetical protein